MTSLRVITFGYANFPDESMSSLLAGPVYESVRLCVFVSGIRSFL